MKQHSILTSYGLKWNPFLAEIPAESLVTTPRMASFCRRLEALINDGGFAMISGEPGTGKSSLLRILECRLAQIRDLVVCPMSRPQSSVMDFYREIGSYFDVPICMSNRWGGYKSLREKWLKYLDTTNLHPVILIDEAQEMRVETILEIKLLASAVFDSRMLITVIFCGDSRLPEKFRAKELYPLGTRIRARCVIEPATNEELVELLQERIERAGNPTLLTRELINTLAEHSAGNPRVMLNTADELFANAVEQKLTQIDEKLFLEVFGRHDQKRIKKERIR